MQRISVDLPEPDGPQITMRSPRATRRSMSVEHLEVAEPLVQAFDHDRRRVAGCLGGGTRSGLRRLGHGGILTCVPLRAGQRRSPRARSRSSHWLYFDIAKQKIQ